MTDPTPKSPAKSPAKTPPHLRRAAVEQLYAEHDYMTAYRMHTDMRVLHDPHAAVGSMWEEIGTL